MYYGLYSILEAERRHWRSQGCARTDEKGMMSKRENFVNGYYSDNAGLSCLNCTLPKQHLGVVFFFFLLI
jgi:hypothetical protein